MNEQPRLFPTQSKEEAHELLRKRRQRLLAAARDLAYELANRRQGVTTQEILATMDARGIMDEEDRRLDQRWIGALWARNAMKEDFDLIDHRVQENKGRNCHAAPRAVWRLKCRCMPFGPCSPDCASERT